MAGQTDRFPGKTRPLPRFRASLPSRSAGRSRGQRRAPGAAPAAGPGTAAAPPQLWAVTFPPAGHSGSRLLGLDTAQGHTHTHRWLLLLRHRVRLAGKAPASRSCFSRDQETRWKADPLLELNSSEVHSVECSSLAFLDKSVQAPNNIFW